MAEKRPVQQPYLNSASHMCTEGQKVGRTVGKEKGFNGKRMGDKRWSWGEEKAEIHYSICEIIKEQKVINQ